MFLLEKTLARSRRHWSWILFLFAVIAAGFVCYLRQVAEGTGITGLSRDVDWGIYIAQFTFLVGVAASAVMVVLPYCLHDCRPFARTIHPRRIPRRRRGHHVHAVHLRRYGAARPGAQRAALSEAVILLSMP